MTRRAAARPSAVRVSAVPPSRDMPSTVPVSTVRVSAVPRADVRVSADMPSVPTSATPSWTNKPSTVRVAGAPPSAVPPRANTPSDVPPSNPLSAVRTIALPSAVRVSTLLLAIALPGAAMAEERVPDPSYFTGIYERVGRTAGNEPQLLDDRVRLRPDPEGQGLLMTVCAPDGAPGTEPLLLRWDDFGEVPNLLSAGDGAADLYCQWFNDAGNYPLILCATGDQRGRYALWAAPEVPAGDCPGG